MSNRAVIGLGFGDEGKGVATEYLCSQDPKNTIVVRFSGGHQAGHKVIKGDIEHVFSSFGSGTLSGCPTYWSQNCTIEPLSFCNEYYALKKAGISPKIYFHAECPITTIYDVFANRQLDSREIKHGTTGTGFFRTRKRHLNDGLAFTAVEALYGSSKGISKKLEKIKHYYGLNEDLNVELFLYSLSRIKSLLDDQVFVMNNVPNYPNKVFEGSQGLMLDEHVGYMPHCTPSDLTPRSITKLGHNLNEVFAITRAYQTRHGSGPMTNEEYPVILSNNEKETNISHKYQGNFRTSVLDLDQLIHAKTKGIDEAINGVKVSLLITCIDQLSEYKLSHNKKIISFNGSSEFAKYIGAHLNINGDLYINDSPYSESVKKLQ